MRALPGIDLGTTGIQRGVQHGRGCADQMQARVRRSGPVDRSRGGEAQAEVSIFLDALRNIIPEILDAARISPSAVHGIAISAMAPDAITVDAHSQALMPCILWMDRRAVAEAEQVPVQEDPGAAEEVRPSLRSGKTPRP